MMSLYVHPEATLAAGLRVAVRAIVGAWVTVYIASVSTQTATAWEAFTADVTQYRESIVLQVQWTSRGYQAPTTTITTNPHKPSSCEQPNNCSVLEAVTT